jgi:SPX domain protein involved in polyphosphate accumulation
MNLKLLGVSDYRYERKYFISNTSVREVETYVFTNPALFKKAYKKRHVNNIYFDTAGLDNYYNNIEGEQHRLKLRVRWYGELFGLIKSPVLEIKIKKGHVGKKISVSIPPFKLSDGVDLSNIFNDIDLYSIGLAISMKSLSPVLMNRYSRKYFLSYDEKYRVTIDSNQYFYNIGRFNNNFNILKKDFSSVIMELKYNKKHDVNAHKISSHFPYRVTKSSKYVNGINSMYNELLAY